MNETKLTIGASHDILLTKQDRFFTIRETEWSRLKRLIESCKINTEWWSIFASVLFGISGSSALSAITLLNDNATTTKIVIWVITGASLLMGILCVIAAVGKRKEMNNHISEVVHTVSEIEAQLPKEQLKTDEK